MNWRNQLGRTRAAATAIGFLLLAWPVGVAAQSAPAAKPVPNGKAAPTGKAAPAAKSPPTKRNWLGVKVLPKKGAIVKVGRLPVDASDWPLPYVVQNLNGKWLWVGDDEKGWVARDQVVTLEEAPAYFTSLISGNPRDAWAYNSRAIAWENKGQLDRAIADYGQELSLLPDATTYVGRAGAWFSKREYDKAIADYDEALRLDPKCATAYAGRGSAWKSKQQCDKAIADYDAAIRLDPHDADYFLAAAWLRATCSDSHYRDGEKAIVLASEACKLTGWTVADCVDALAAAYAEKGDFATAMKHETRAVELNPGDRQFVRGARDRLKLYTDKQPFHEQPVPEPPSPEQPMPEPPKPEPPSPK